MQNSRSDDRWYDAASPQENAPSTLSVPSTAAAAKEVDEEELKKALNTVVHDSLAPILIGLSILYLVQMVTHMLLLSRTNAVYISLMAAGSSVVLLLLRVVLMGIDPESNRVYALSVATSAIALINTLWSQALTEDVEVVVMALLLVGTGFVFLSTAWFIPVLGGSLLSWLVATGMAHQVEALFFPAIGLVGAAALAMMMHIVRRRTNLRAERLRRAMEQQQESLAQTVMVKERHERELEESEQSLQDTLSDLQKTKKALERREVELSRTVEQLTEAKEKAEEASQLKSAMLANMSHEVRTPLTSITGFAEVLTEEASGQVHQFATLIHENSKRLLETLSSVLRLSKLEAGKQDLHFESIDLVEEAEAIVTEQKDRAEEAGIDLHLDAPNRCSCVLDPGAVQRILRNLVGNAIKFTDSGGEVAVRVSCVVRSSDDEPEDASFTHVELEVEDTGAGMSESFQENMFEAFQQESEDPRRSAHEGSGLGLSITKELVELLRGDVTVESELGVGTCFTITLPRDPREDGGANGSV